MDVNKLPLLVITAPSCAGKDYLTKTLFQRHPNTFSMVVSTTTRPPRVGEIDGVDYHFLSQYEFDKLNNDSKLLESVQFGSKCYGTSLNSIQEIQQKGQFPVLIVEPNGAKKIKAWCEDNDQEAKFVFLKIDREVALERFLNRFISDLQNLELEDSIDKKTDRVSERYNNLIENYTNRIYISMYQESDWDKALDYNLKFDPLIEPKDAETVADLLANIYKKGHNVESSLGLKKVSKKASCVASLAPSAPPSDMKYIIRKALSSAKENQVTSNYLKSIILKSEQERLNQKTFNF